MESLFLQRQYCRVTIFPNNIIDPKAACTSENCECGCRLLWSVEPFKKQPALTVFQVQAAFGKIRTLVAPSPQPSIAHNASASPPSAYCNTSRPACNSYSASPPSTSRSAVCSLTVICGYGRAWRCLCGAHVKQRLPENRFTDFQAASRLSRFQAFAIVDFQKTPHNRWQATATRLPAK